MSVADYEVDYSEVEGRKAECVDGCGMCCLCQPEVLPQERQFFRKNHPECLVKSRGPEQYFALALKKGRGSCVFLDDRRRCRVYDHRTTYCRQFPYHLYVSDRVKVEMDLSCRGLWTGRGADALAEAKQIVAAAGERLERALAEASAVYGEFYDNARAAGVMADPELLRLTVAEHLQDFTDLGFISRILSMAEAEPQISMSGARRDERYDLADLNDAARETALESLSTDDPLGMPVYSAEDLSWNVFSVDGGKIEWMTVGDDGEFRHRGMADASEISIKPLNDEGSRVLSDYLGILNGRDSFMGSVYYLVDANGYEDDLSNAYYGSLATAVLDILWRAALLDRFFGTGFGARGIREAIIFYDMDRLDAPAIGAFV